MSELLSADTRRKRRSVAGVSRLRATIAWHPDRRRVGASTWLETSPGADGVPINRAAPLFGDDDTAAPLLDPFISRAPVTVAQVTESSWTLSADAERTGLTVVGRDAADVHRFGAAALRDGVSLVLQDRVALLLTLHEVQDGSAAVSLPLATLRERLTAAAGLDVPMVIVGPPGVAKSDIARLAHEASVRSDGPWVVATAASWQGDRDGAVLRGRADHSEPGLIAAAQGGTLLVESIDEAPEPVQVALVQLIDHGSWVPVGGAAVRHGDVRVAATCHRDLDEAVRRRRLRDDLMRRLRGFEVSVAPLARRRVDLPRILLDALDQEFAARDKVMPLPTGDDDPWLPARLAAGLIAGQWPGNERSFRNVLRDMVLRHADSPHAALEHQAWRRAGLDVVALRQMHGERVTSGELSVEAVRRAMQACAYRAAEAARMLGASRSNLYGFMRAHPDAFRLATDLDASEIQRALAAVGDDVAAAAMELEVSERSLVLRISQLGLAD